MWALASILYTLWGMLSLALVFLLFVFTGEKSNAVQTTPSPASAGVAHFWL
jgi:hypothetical protein